MGFLDDLDRIDKEKSLMASKPQGGFLARLDEIDAEMQRILTEGYAETEKKLQIHMDKLVAVAERLMITEKMEGDEFLKIMESSN